VSCLNSVPWRDSIIEAHPTGDGEIDRPNPRVRVKLLHPACVLLDELSKVAGAAISTETV